MFQAAAATVNAPLSGAWVLGDSPHADIGGADALGVRPGKAVDSDHANGTLVR
ncbi:HAD hydrolase-like protein [Streptomyces coeruleorubidus]|uniref:HAD hydrolase-like protein n=1 Tax=Streptomyces coeruleorubidus TaxID=116188 RepID=UPI00237EE9FE|nr:HAD hydrolase-like protein [Streptomyces coeruleorubidus]WDV57041.1 HAD hydrolase-like protein [Streptomyces coeruleorubidus]